MPRLGVSDYPVHVLHVYGDLGGSATIFAKYPHHDPLSSQKIRLTLRRVLREVV